MPLSTDLDALLQQVSRSFYLSLQVLPRSLRAQLKVAYLVARAADTIADTRILPAALRLELLAALRTALTGEQGPLRDGISAALRAGSSLGAPAERELLAKIGECLDVLASFADADRFRSDKVLGTLITGMERDLTRFPNAQPDEPPPAPIALATPFDLEEHAYYAAGCVGEFWTLMCAAHVPGLERLSRPDFVARGVRLGKALQYVNVLRDIPSDLREGRCYLPASELAHAGLTPLDLVGPGDATRRDRLAPLFESLRQRALAHVDAAFPYVMAIPATQPRLRLAALWPLWIGLATLEGLRDARDPLNPDTLVKITRRSVYEIVVESVSVAMVDRWLVARHELRRERAA